jgi:predicted ferric reductase
MINDKEIILAIKKYSSNEFFPNGGKASQYITSIKPGEKVMADVPLHLNNIRYSKSGELCVNNNIVKYYSLFVISAGTGITGFSRFFDSILNDENDNTSIKFLHFNKDEDNIVLQDKIKEWSVFKNISIFTILTSKDGYLTKDLIIKYFGNIKNNIERSLFFVCGPTSLLYEASIILEDLSFPKERIIKL